MVSEKEIEAAIKAIEAVPIMGDTYSLSGEDAKAAARAALEAAARVRAEAEHNPKALSRTGTVKPLEWVASDDCEYRWTADLYAIEDQGKNWSTDRYWLYYNGQRLGKFGTLDTALFTAQADYDRRILSALTAGKPEQSGWQPIETAPRDGTEFQAWIEKYGWEPRARFNPNSEAFELWGRVDYDKDGWDVYPHMVPTHWMPIPTPPTAGGGDE